MYKPNLRLPLFCLLSFVCSIADVTTTASPISQVHETFLRCMKNKTTSSSDQIIFAQSNNFYTSVLKNYSRNSRFNSSSTLKPLIIITPTTESEIQATVVCSKQVGYRLKIRSGGHDYDGLSYISDTPFFILDMFNFRNISVNIPDESAWVGAGATLGELYYRIAEKSKVHGFPAGVCPTIGVGGHLSGAGYGNMIRKYGLSVDHIIDAKLIDVNGNLLDRKSMGEDVFWAIRGGGGASFGVVLAFRIKLVPVPETVTFFKVVKTLNTNALDMVYKWQSIAPKTDPGLFMRLFIKPAMNTDNVTSVQASIQALYLGKSADVVSFLGEKFPELGLKKEDCIEGSWIQSTIWWYDDKRDLNKTEYLLERNLGSSIFFKRKSDYVSKEMTKEDLDKVFRKIILLKNVELTFNPYGGKMNETSPTITPFPHRQRLWKIQYAVNWREGGEGADSMNMEKIRRMHGYMTKFVTKNPRYSFFAYRDVDIGVNRHRRNSYGEGEIYGRKYFGENFDRLVKVKTEFDPENYFRNEQSIPTKSII